MKRKTSVKTTFCKSVQENPICYTEDCNCGKPILLHNNWLKDERARIFMRDVSPAVRAAFKKRGLLKK